MFASCSRLVVSSTLVVASVVYPSDGFVNPGGASTIFSDARSSSLGSTGRRANREVTRVSAVGPKKSTPTPIRPGRVTVPVESIEKSPAPKADKIGKKKASLPLKSIKEEGDERQTARWGVPPVKLPSENPLLAPISAVSKSLRTVGQGATNVKDALYRVADGAGSLVELTQQSVDNVVGKDTRAGAEQSIAPATLQPSSTSKEGGDSMFKTLGALLSALGSGAVVLKDALWGSIEVLGDAVDAAQKAPDVARTVTEEGKAALEGAKQNVQAVVRAPGQAVEAVSKTVDSVGRAASVIKDGAYGTVDAVAQLASAPAEIAERRRLEQEERQEKASKEAKMRRETARKIGSAVTGAKAAVWGTVEGVETLVETVASAPAAVESGFGRAQEAANSAGHFVANIPRAPQEFRREAQQKVDDVKSSVAATQASVGSVFSGLKGGLDGASKIAQRAAAVASGEEKREREQREKKAKEEARKKKERDAIVIIQGEPYDAKDLAVAAGSILGETAKGAVRVGKAVVSFAYSAKDAPAEIARTVLGPFYNYQQSRRRVREALAKQTPPPPPPSAGSLKSESSTVGSSLPANSPPIALSSTDSPAVASSSTVGSSEDTPKIPTGKSSVRKAVTEERAAEVAFMDGLKAEAEDGMGVDGEGKGVRKGVMDREGVLDTLTTEGVSSAAEEAEQSMERDDKKSQDSPRRDWSRTGFGK